MSEMFNSLYDEIFLQDNRVMQENEKINNVTRKYIESKAKDDEKKFFLKLRKEYLKIKNIKNYGTLQNRLSANKSRSEIISFEIVRILNNAGSNVRVSQQVADIEKLLAMCDGVLADDIYTRIVNLIIKIEISLGMRIGLFNELCCSFEREIEKIEIESSVHTRKM